MNYALMALLSLSPWVPAASAAAPRPLPAHLRMGIRNCIQESVRQDTVRHDVENTYESQATYRCAGRDNAADLYDDLKEVIRTGASKHVTETRYTNAPITILEFLDLGPSLDQSSQVAAGQIRCEKDERDASGPAIVTCQVTVNLALALIRGM